MTARVINDPSALGWEYDPDTGRWTWGGGSGDGGGGGNSVFPEAPVNGKQYGRQDAGWTEIVHPDSGGGGGTAGPDPRISDTQIANWETSFSWGDHGQVDYMRWSEFSETDPTVPSHVKAITQADINKWNSGTGGDGGDNGDGEGGEGGGGDDPRITDTQISNWDEAHGWGDHKLMDYATEEWVTDKNYATQLWVNDKNYATELWVTNKKYATETWVTNKNYATQTWVTQQQYATQSWVTSNYQAKGNYALTGASYTKAESDNKYELKGGGGHNGVDAIQIAAKGLGLGSSESVSEYASNSIIEMQSEDRINGGLPSHTGYRMSVKMTGAWGDQQFFFNCATGWKTYNSTPALSIANSGCTAADFIATSDERLKDNISTAPTGVVEHLTGREWDWSTSGAKAAGVVAQELEQVLPHLVHENDEGIKSVSYNGLVAYLIEEVKELKAELKELKNSGC